MLDLFFKLRDVKHESINLGRPLQEDLAFKVGSEGELFLLHALLELSMGNFTPVLEQSVHLLTVQGVPSVGLLARLALVDGEIFAPSFPDDSLGKKIAFLCKEAGKTTVLLLMHSTELFCILCLRLNRHIHFNKPIVTSGRILIIVELVLTHVTSTHVAVLLK